MLREQRILQQPENSHAIRSSNEDFAVRDHRRDELISRRTDRGSAGLVAVVELVQIRGIVSMQHGGLRQFSTAHTIALLVPFAEMLGVAPG